jgi:hypothetical protein
LPLIVYGPADAVRKAQVDGTISFQGRDIFPSHGLQGQPLAVRPSGEEDFCAVWYSHHQAATVD